MCFDEHRGDLRGRDGVSEVEGRLSGAPRKPAKRARDKRRLRPESGERFSWGSGGAESATPSRRV